MRDRYFETPEGHVGLEVDNFYTPDGRTILLMYDNGKIASYKETEIVETDYQLSLDV